MVPRGAIFFYIKGGKLMATLDQDIEMAEHSVKVMAFHLQGNSVL